MSGLSTTGSISLGEALVAGRNRVPRPATGNTALVIFCIVFSTEHLEELLLVDHGDAQLARLVELGAGLFAGHDVVGLLRHGTGDLAAEGLDALGRLVARHARERPGEHDDFTREGSRGGRALSLPRHS